MKTVVVFLGNAGHGKNAAADFLIARVGGAQMAFADPLKEAAAALFGIPREVLYGTKDIKESHVTYGRTCRRWLQWLGTDVARQQIHPDIWIHRFADRVVSSPHDVIACSDGRFTNEVIALRERLGSSARVYAVRIINTRVLVDLSHPSESEVHGLPDSFFDWKIENEGTLDDLRSKVTTLAAYLGLRTTEPASHVGGVPI